VQKWKEQVAADLVMGSTTASVVAPAFEPMTMTSPGPKAYFKSERCGSVRCRYSVKKVCPLVLPFDAFLFIATKLFTVTSGIILDVSGFDSRKAL
jgi:hypothetical protein